MKLAMVNLRLACSMSSFLYSAPQNWRLRPELLRLRLAAVPAHRGRAVRAYLQSVLDWFFLAAAGHSPATIKAPLGIAGNVVENGGSAHDALVLVQRMFEEPARVAGISRHQVSAHHAVGVRQAVWKAVRFRHQQKPRRFQAIGRQHHRFGFLEYLPSSGRQNRRPLLPCRSYRPRFRGRSCACESRTGPVFSAIGIMVTAELDLAFTWQPKPEHIPQLTHPDRPI